MVDLEESKDNEMIMYNIVARLGRSNPDALGDNENRNLLILENTGDTIATLTHNGYTPLDYVDH